jgi:hypothetical protein
MVVGSTAVLFSADEDNQVPALRAMPNVANPTESIVGWNT